MRRSTDVQARPVQQIQEAERLLLEEIATSGPDTLPNVYERLADSGLPLAALSLATSRLLQRGKLRQDQQHRIASAPTSAD